jgi:YegS/Rv2252/BmrU family lipid kinase
MESGTRNENAWLVIVNPNAGQRKGEKDWPEISRLLTEAGFEFSAFFTARQGHAMELAEQEIMAGFKKIIVVGGDGTLNEVVNGIFRQTRFATHEIIIGMIMVGTGNDWGRMYNIREKYKKAVKTIRKNRLFLQDACKVTYQHEHRVSTRYLVNMAGMGYDALVAHMTNRVKAKGGGGTFSYLFNLLKGLFRYNHAYLEIAVDGESVYNGKVFSMNVGICKFNGGGMMQLPHAIPDDGLLDITIFKNVTKLRVIRNIKKLYSGTFTQLPFVQVHRGQIVSVVSTVRAQTFLEMDGESMGQTPFHFEVVPKAVCVITGKNWQEKNGQAK